MLSNVVRVCRQRGGGPWARQQPGCSLENTLPVTPWSAGIDTEIQEYRQYSSNDSNIDYIIEANLDKKSFRRKDDEGRQILTTRREALSLYREIMRITALFDWPNEQGVLWRDVLRASARQEFEEARYEQDPEVVNRLLVVGRDAVHQVAEKFLQKRNSIHNNNDTDKGNR
ncbi:hypothetical protein M9435_000403 [Picochlorum sp. BPE23]|nr:hypothetical protein M9435_000403 [Picochlorum sp. BPE23]